MLILHAYDVPCEIYLQIISPKQHIHNNNMYYIVQINTKYTKNCSAEYTNNDKIYMKT